jgi:NAD(P)H dehydrogenase (quinone)
MSVLRRQPAWLSRISIMARPTDWGTRRRPIARTFTEVIGQPFSYEARPPEEFYRNVLAAGAEPSYMKCVFNSYTDYTAGRIPHSDDVFDNLPAIAGRKPITLAEFAKKHADKFRY